MTGPDYAEAVARAEDERLTPEENPLDEKKLVAGFTLILEGLGLHGDNPHFTETPRRAAKAWYHELCKGITGQPPTITTFPSDVDEMIILKHIPIRSVCAHHLLPFHGEAAVAYIPGAGRILGLSKLSRIADYYSRRPQVQEELTAQIANAVAEQVMDAKVGPFTVFSTGGGVGVVVRATHMCMELRGVNHSGEMVTSALRGVFRQPEVREEFLRLINHKE